jgi:hypothetical protein
LILGGILAWIGAARVYGLYAFTGGRGRPALLDDAVGVTSLMTLGVWAVVVASYSTGKPDPDVKQLLAFWLLAIAATTTARQLVRRPGGGALQRRPPLWPVESGELPLDRGLVVADCVTLFVVFTACRRFVEEPLPADSTALGWVFVLAGLPAWTAAARWFGHYEPAGASLRRDLVGCAHLATFGAWLLIAMTPYTGEINPDIPRVMAVWLVTIAAVPAARRLARAGVRPAHRGRARRRTPSG